MSAGRIQNETWKPLENISRSQVGEYYVKYDNINFRLFESLHYLRISSINNVIGLSDIDVPFGSVVTGK